MDTAIDLALDAERAGNPPVGAVIVLDGAIIAAGANCIVSPVYHPGRHAATEALSRVPAHLWPSASRMSCFTTLEPCPMCLTALVLHGIGCIVYGAPNPLSGGGMALAALPPIFATELGMPRLIGPVNDDVCAALAERAQLRFIAVRAEQGRDAK